MVLTFVKNGRERELTKRIYRSKIDAGNVRGQPPIKWEDRVMEYVRERASIPLALFQISKNYL